MAGPQTHAPSRSLNGTINGYENQPRFTPKDYITNVKDQFDYTLAMLTHLFEEKEQLSTDLDNARLDLANTTEQNRDFRREIVELRRMVEESHRELTCNNYALVLIDGDGMTFRRDLLKEGRAGGEKAADRLRKHVFDDTGLKPIIRIFANVEGLSRAMKNQGLIQNPNAFREFSVGVSDPRHEQIDFVDVGEGKEMADWKLKTELEWHLKNYNCRTVILGASHDNGYARVLKKFEDEEALEKIQLLEGPPFGRELEALRFKRVKYDDVFSSEKFDVYQQQRSPVLTMAATATNTSAAKVNNVTTTVTSYAAAVTTAPVITPPASVGHGSPRPQKAVVQYSEGMIQEAIRKIKQLRPKPCNNHYLKGECTYGDDDCTFGHRYPLKPDELQAMRRLAAQKQCNFGKDCINEKCYYSHD